MNHSPGDRWWPGASRRALVSSQGLVRRVPPPREGTHASLWKVGSLSTVGATSSPGAAARELPSPTRLCVVHHCSQQQGTWARITRASLPQMTASCSPTAPASPCPPLHHQVPFVCADPFLPHLLGAPLPAVPVRPTLLLRPSLMLSSSDPRTHLPATPGCPPAHTTHFLGSS